MQTDIITIISIVLPSFFLPDRRATHSRYEVKSKPSPASGIRGALVSSAFATSLDGESIKPNDGQDNGSATSRKTAGTDKQANRPRCPAAYLGCLRRNPGFYVPRKSRGRVAAT